MRFYRRIPGSIVVLTVATVVAWVLHLPVETIESRFGGIPSGLFADDACHRHHKGARGTADLRLRPAERGYDTNPATTAV